MNSKRLLGFFALSYLISWILWLPLWLPAFGINVLPVIPYHHALGAFGPMIAGLIMAYKSSPGNFLQMGRSMFRIKDKLLCIITALFSPFLILIIAIIVNGALNYEALDFSGIGRSREFPEFGLFAFFLYNVFTFGYGEETGWRGFALPELQKKFNPLTASILLTFGWAAWHIPLFFYRPGYVSMDAAGITGWFFSLLTGSILLTWIYNRSKSILVCALFHATIDIVFTSDLKQASVTMVTGALITVWGLVTILIFRKDFFRKKGNESV